MRARGVATGRYRDRAPSFAEAVERDRLIDEPLVPWPLRVVLIAIGVVLAAVAVAVAVALS